MNILSKKTDAPVAPKNHSVSVELENDGKAKIAVRRTVGGHYDNETKRFYGPLSEAIEFAAALSDAILQATRLEGAVASLYPVKG